MRNDPREKETDSQAADGGFQAGGQSGGMASPQQYSVEDKATAQNLLRTYTGRYRHNSIWNNYQNAFLNPHKPIFRKMWVPVMMNDPHVWYGMEILKGPIVSKALYTVECEDMEVADFIDRQIKNFWRKGIVQALECLIWGYSCCEVVYEWNSDKGQMDYKELKYLHPMDVKAVHKDGKFKGAEIKNVKDDTNPVYLSGKKLLWCVNETKHHRWYGRSRLQGCFEPWWEINFPKGYKAIRHLWMYRGAFDGGILYYPDGATQDPETGEEIPNGLIAQEMLDRKETGSALALPNKTGDNRDWEWEEAKGQAIPEGLLEYGDVLRDEVWAGMGVPPEVAKSEGTGSFSGRRVPQQAFYSSLQELANDRMWEFEEQVLKGILLPINGMEGVPFKLQPVSILQTLQQEEMGLVTGSIPGQDGQGMEGEDEQEFDEEGNPIESEGDEENSDFGQPSKLSNGRIEDRNSNAFNLSEKAVKNNKKKQKGTPK